MDTLNDLIAIVVALRWVLVALAFMVLGALYADSIHGRREADDLATSLDAEVDFLNRRLAAASRVDQEKVLAFINERPDYIRAIENTSGDPGDLNRWRGNAEARRMLASRLGLTVPHHVGEVATPSTARARAVNR